MSFNSTIDSCALEDVFTQTKYRPWTHLPVFSATKRKSGLPPELRQSSVSDQASQHWSAMSISFRQSTARSESVKQVQPTGFRHYNCLATSPEKATCEKACLEQSRPSAYLDIWDAAQPAFGFGKWRLPSEKHIHIQLTCSAYSKYMCITYVPKCAVSSMCLPMLKSEEGQQKQVRRNDLDRIRLNLAL